MSKIQDQVREFAEKFGIGIAEEPTLPSLKERILRCTLVMEEALELVEASGLMFIQCDDGNWALYAKPDAMPDIVAVADATGDLAYVVEGVNLKWGIDSEVVGAEVHRSNMSKVWPDGTVHRRADGKVMKPETYSPPNLEPIVFKSLQGELV